MRPTQNDQDTLYKGMFLHVNISACIDISKESQFSFASPGILLKGKLRTVNFYGWQVGRQLRWSVNYLHLQLELIITLHQLLVGFRQLRLCNLVQLLRDLQLLLRHL